MEGWRARLVTAAHQGHVSPLALEGALGPGGKGMCGVRLFASSGRCLVPGLEGESAPVPDLSPPGCRRL